MMVGMKRRRRGKDSNVVLKCNLTYNFSRRHLPLFYVKTKSCISNVKIAWWGNLLILDSRMYSKPSKERQD